MYRDTIKYFPQFMKKIFHEHDISRLKLNINKTQTYILMTVNENPGSSMTEISIMTGLEKSSFTRSVDILEKQGLIKRNSPKEDRRKIQLSLTGKGRKAATLIQEDFDRHLNSLITHFSENEKSDFLKSLTILSGYINNILTRK